MIKKILVSQPKPASEKSPYYDIEKEYGVECVFRPFFKVEGLTAKEFRQQKINLLDYTAVVFTSRHAVDNYFKLAKEMRITIPEDMKYFCDTGKIDGLMAQMSRHKGEKYLVPLSSVHNDDVKNLLDEKKLNHTECVMYRTVSNDFTEEEIKSFDYDMMIFFSPTGVKALKKNFPKFEQGKIALGAFGPATMKTVTDEGLRIDLEAPTKEFPSMTGALKDYLKRNNK